MTTAKKPATRKRATAVKRTPAAPNPTQILKREVSDLKKALRSVQAELRQAERREQKMQNVITCMKEIQKISNKATRTAPSATTVRKTRVKKAA